MAVEELKYTIASDGTNPGSMVDIFLTYDENSPAPGPGVYMKYAVTAASGSYTVLNADNTTTSYNIGNIVPQNVSNQGQDNLILLEGGQIVDGSGISFSVPGFAGDDGNGNINFFYGDGGNQGTGYQELGANANDATNVSYGPSSTPCFASGTRIRTSRGQIAVEELAVGDLVETSQGAFRPVLWLGHRSVDPRRHPRPQDVRPFRVAAHAFAENRPDRDLFLSPGHAICVDCVGEVLIPVSALGNGTTIAQMDVDEVTYWHVELDGHDIVFANNLRSESYLDMGNRHFFAEAEVVALNASPDAVEPAARTHADFCRPFHHSGPLVDATRSRLSARVEDRSPAPATGTKCRAVG